jgi:signal transduction histidine kinase
MANPGDLSRGQLLGLAFPVLLVLALAAALAVQSLDATREHRESVRQTLHDYADFAAHIIASGAWQEMERRLLYAFAPLRIWNEGEPLPPAAALGRDRAELTRCAAEGDSVPVLARLLIPDGRLETAGRTADAQTLRWLTDTLTAIVANEPASETRFGHIIERARRARVWAYAALRDSGGGAIAIYAKSSCLSSDGISIFARAMAERPALPPTSTRGVPNDSLLAVRVEDTHGTLVWASAADDTTGASGLSVWPRLGAVRVRVFIRPEIAQSLVIGGLPPSRLPAAALLFLLASGFAGFAIQQIRRQQTLMRMRERFVANVSHELRTPLQQILVFTELLRMEKLRTEEERKHSLEVIERETHRLILLVDNVLRFSRSEQGQVALNQERIDVAAVARDTIQIFLPLARTSDANIVLDAPGPAQAIADPDAVRRIVLNLLDNAVKYGPRGQTIRVSVGQGAGRAIVSIEDEGPGIPAGERMRVWQPFRRMERDEAGNAAGSGMGLAIVHDLITRLGGRAYIEDGTNRGARFVFELPAPVTGHPPSISGATGAHEIALPAEGKAHS